MSKSNVVFALYHMYDETIDSILLRESKRIGFFENRQQCEDIIEEFKQYKGFKDYPETCFKILEYNIGQEYWKDEFLVD